MTPDTNDTVYTVAFCGDRFLMVWNPRRKGWEMPGGHVQVGESRLDAARREFREEAGYEVEIREVRDLGYCRVFAAYLGARLPTVCEMEAQLFDTLPAPLFFDRAEYEDVIPWARDALAANR